MATMMLVDRDSVRIKLRTVFDARTADTLLDVLDNVAMQVAAAGVPREDFTELKQIVVGLAEDHRKVEDELARLATLVSLLVEQVRSLTTLQQQMNDKLGNLEGQVLELTYHKKAAAYFGRLLRRPKVVEVNSLWESLETCLAKDELNDVLLLDLIVKGVPRDQPERGECWLAVEISAVIDPHDVERAQRRAALLQKAGYQAIPVAAGQKITLEAETEAQAQSVAILQDGRSFLWDEALTRWLNRQADSQRLNV